MTSLPHLVIRKAVDSLGRTIDVTQHTSGVDIDAEHEKFRRRLKERREAAEAYSGKLEGGSVGERARGLEIRDAGEKSPKRGPAKASERELEIRGKKIARPSKKEPAASKRRLELGPGRSLNPPWKKDSIRAAEGKDRGPDDPSRMWHAVSAHSTYDSKPKDEITHRTTTHGRYIHTEDHEGRHTVTYHPHEGADRHAHFTRARYLTPAQTYSGVTRRSQRHYPRQDAKFDSKKEALQAAEEHHNEQLGTGSQERKLKERAEGITKKDKPLSGGRLNWDGLPRDATHDAETPHGSYSIRPTLHGHHVVYRPNKPETVQSVAGPEERSYSEYINPPDAKAKALKEGHSVVRRPKEGYVGSEPREHYARPHYTLAGARQAAEDHHNKISPPKDTSRELEMGPHQPQIPGIANHESDMRTQQRGRSLEIRAKSIYSGNVPLLVLSKAVDSLGRNIPTVQHEGSVDAEAEHQKFLDRLRKMREDERRYGKPGEGRPVGEASGPGDRDLEIRDPGEKAPKKPSVKPSERELEIREPERGEDGGSKRRQARRWSAPDEDGVRTLHTAHGKYTHRPPGHPHGGIHEHTVTYHPKHSPEFSAQTTTDRYGVRDHEEVRAHAPNFLKKDYRGHVEDTNGAHDRGPHHDPLRSAKDVEDLVRRHRRMHSEDEPGKMKWRKDHKRRAQEGGNGERTQHLDHGHYKVHQTDDGRWSTTYHPHSRAYPSSYGSAPYTVTKQNAVQVAPGKEGEGHAEVPVSQAYGSITSNSSNPQHSFETKKAAQKAALSHHEEHTVWPVKGNRRTEQRGSMLETGPGKARGDHWKGKHASGWHQEQQIHRSHAGTREWGNNPSNDYLHRETDHGHYIVTSRGGEHRVSYHAGHVASDGTPDYHITSPTRNDTKDGKAHGTTERSPSRRKDFGSAADAIAAAEDHHFHTSPQHAEERQSQRRMREVAAKDKPHKPGEDWSVDTSGDRTHNLNKPHGRYAIQGHPKTGYRVAYRPGLHTEHEVHTAADGTQTPRSVDYHVNPPDAKASAMGDAHSLRRRPKPGMGATDDPMSEPYSRTHKTLARAKAAVDDHIRKMTPKPDTSRELEMGPHQPQIPGLSGHGQDQRTQARGRSLEIRGSGGPSRAPGTPPARRMFGNPQPEYAGGSPQFNATVPSANSENVERSLRNIPLYVISKSGGPYIGPRGGKWADPEHKTPWHGAEEEAIRRKGRKANKKTAPWKGTSYVEPDARRVANPDAEVPSKLRQSPYIRVKGEPHYRKDTELGNVVSTRSAYKQAEEHGIELESYREKLALLPASEQHLMLVEALAKLEEAGSDFPLELVARMRANKKRSSKAVAKKKDQRSRKAARGGDVHSAQSADADTSAAKLLAARQQILDSRN